MNNRENYLITIDGTQTLDGEQETVSLSTHGNFVAKDDASFVISYRETEATGYSGDLTTLKIENEDRVTMLRVGSANSQLIIENGVKHLSHYETPFGGLMIGVRGESIENKLGEHGGELLLKYSLDLNASEISHNQLSIKVRERNHV